MPAVTAAVAAIGIGLAVGGTAMSISAAHDAAEANQGIARQEMKADKQREQQMELDAQRRLRENIRNVQRARSVALNNAVSQGAQFGSGLAGGYGQIAGVGGNEDLGVRQNLQIGRNLFDINRQISAYKMDLADAQYMSSFGSGLTSLGGSLMGSAGTMGNIFGSANSAYGGFGQAQRVANFNYNYPRGMV